MDEYQVNLLKKQHVANATPFCKGVRQKMSARSTDKQRTQILRVTSFDPTIIAKVAETDLKDVVNLGWDLKATRMIVTIPTGVPVVFVTRSIMSRWTCLRIRIIGSPDT